MKKTFFIFNTKVFILVFGVYLLYYPFKAFILNEDIGGGSTGIYELFITMALGILFNAFLYSAIATFIYWTIRKLRHWRTLEK